MRHAIQEFDINPDWKGMAELLEPVRYSQAHEDCMVHLITPWCRMNMPEKKQPLILFLQGSGFTHPNVLMEIPQLSAFARNGYTVATVVHRNAEEGHPFPAYLEDVKTALRFLRAHAGEYAIDPKRVCVWGTSSGGNAALLMGLTGDDPRYKTAEYAEESDAVEAVVDCFGPADIPGFIDLEDPVNQHKKLLISLAGNADPMTVGRAMSPIHYVKTNREYPPFMILHGDADTVVPYDQSQSMAETLDAAGADVLLCRVRGGVHEGNFWSQPLIDRIGSWIAEHL